MDRLNLSLTASAKVIDSKRFYQS